MDRRNRVTVWLLSLGAALFVGAAAIGCGAPAAPTLMGVSVAVPCSSGLRGDLRRERYEVLECIEGQVRDRYHEIHGVDLRRVHLAPAMRRLVTEALTRLARTRPLPALSDGLVPWEAGPDGLGDQAERHGYELVLAKTIAPRSVIVDIIPRCGKHRCDVTVRPALAARSGGEAEEDGYWLWTQACELCLPTLSDIMDARRWQEAQVGHYVLIEV